MPWGGFMCVHACRARRPPLTRAGIVWRNLTVAGLHCGGQTDEGVRRGGGGAGGCDRSGEKTTGQGGPRGWREKEEEKIEKILDCELARRESMIGLGGLCMRFRAVCIYSARQKLAEGGGDDKSKS